MLRQTETLRFPCPCRKHCRKVIEVEVETVVNLVTKSVTNDVAVKKSQFTFVPDKNGNMP